MQECNWILAPKVAIRSIPGTVIEPIPKPVKRVKIPKRINQRGRVYREWQEDKATWFEENPPTIDGIYWQCWVCGEKVDRQNLDLDHVEERSTHPGLRRVQSNFKPTHSWCNRVIRKGGTFA
jgi:5-methylcytosine-specific restriction endonuclease McrA